MRERVPSKARRVRVSRRRDLATSATNVDGIMRFARPSPVTGSARATLSRDAGEGRALLYESEPEEATQMAIAKMTPMAAPGYPTMALEKLAKKTEHAGAKDMAHDKFAPRRALKGAARKLRRADGAALAHDARAAPRDENPT